MKFKPQAGFTSFLSLFQTFLPLLTSPFIIFLKLFYFPWKKYAICPFKWDIVNCIAVNTCQDIVLCWIVLFRFYVRERVKEFLLSRNSLPNQALASWFLIVTAFNEDFQESRSLRLINKLSSSKQWMLQVSKRGRLGRSATLKQQLETLSINVSMIILEFNLFLVFTWRQKKKLNLKKN